MSKTSIEWTEHTWNPIRALARHVSYPNAEAAERAKQKGWACVKVSPGCANCYAEGINRRFGPGQDYTQAGIKGVETYLDEAVLREPLSWKKPRMVFVCSMTDLFGEWVTDEMLDRVFAVMALAPQHTFQVLTKRAERMEQYMVRRRTIIDSFSRKHGGSKIEKSPCDDVYRIVRTYGGHEAQELLWPLPNVWLGVSVEDQQRADERIPFLLRTPAAVRWLSVEPMLGPVDLKPDEWLIKYRWTSNREDSFQWVVCGGESGNDARPMHPGWARGLRDQCSAAGVPFFFKQWGEWTQMAEGFMDVDLKKFSPSMHYFPDKGIVMQRLGKKRAGRLLDGVLHDALPGKPAVAPA